MRKLFVYPILIVLFILLFSCRVPEISTDPAPDGEKYKAVTIRVKAVSDKGKEKTKILLGFSDKGDRLIFLGPMNQVLFEILVSGNYSKIIVPKKKQYWEGEFSKFLFDLWNIDLTYNEIKALLLEQRVNAKKLRDSGFSMQILESEKKKYPVSIHLSSNDLRLEFKIYEVMERPGRIILKKELEGYAEVSLEKMIRSKSE